MLTDEEDKQMIAAIYAAVARHEQAKREAARARHKRWKENNRETYLAGKRRYSRMHRFNYLADGYKWEEVEGFDNWTTNTQVHHRWEGLGYSRKELKAMGKYYNCRPAELLCMSPSEHRKLHIQIKQDIVKL